jgi:hypothetical protein
MSKLGRFLVMRLSTTNVRYGSSLIRNPPFRSREEFRAPAGVRKSPRTNPRAAREVYGDFDFGPAVERARGLAWRVSVDTDRRHRSVIKLVRGGEWRFVVTARALTGVDSASDIAAGIAGAAGRGEARLCRVMARSSRSMQCGAAALEADTSSGERLDDEHMYRTNEASVLAWARQLRQLGTHTTPVGKK